MGSLLGGKGTKSQDYSSGAAQSSGFSSSTARSNAASESSTTPGFLGELQTVLNRQLSGNTGFTKADAINDVSGVLRQQATEALQSVMPQLAKVDRTSGAYNSTTRDLLQNDAEARITSQLSSNAADLISKYAQIEQGNIGAFADATKAGTSQSATSNQSSSTDSYSQEQMNQWNSGEKKSSGGGSGLLGLFADGGQVPTYGDGSIIKDFFTQTFDMAKGTIEDPSREKIKDTYDKFGKVEGKVDEAIEGYLADAVLSFFGFQDGGQVPAKADNQLLQAIAKHKAGGEVRSGESDVKAGGKIRGPQSKTGEDNQVIGVAGGEGILAKDVMEVPGVPELVEFLNSKYHKPIK